MAHRPVETPREHIRVALELLDELEDQLRARSVGVSFGRSAHDLEARTFQSSDPE